MGVVIVLAFVYAGVNLTAPWLDTLDQQWVSCEVVDASPSQGSNRSMTPWRVVVETTNCGEVLYTSGTTEDNAEAVADSFEPGEYEFKLSWVSRRAADGLIPTWAPTAYDYRQVPSS